MKDLKVALIAAVGLNNEIGICNKLPWYSPSDLKNFKDITQNGIIIMGRKTFESLPKLLPNRKHIVISRNVLQTHTSKVSYYNTIERALNDCRNNAGVERVFIIGGSTIYKEVIDKDLINELYITSINWTGNADKFFPKLDTSKWDLNSQIKREATIEDPLTWTFRKYTKNI